MSLPKHIPLFIFQLFCCIMSFAQSEQIDSLKLLLPALKDSARIDCLNALSEAYRKVEIDTTTLFAEQALKEAEKINYMAGEGAAYYNLAKINEVMGGDFRKMEENAYNAVTVLNRVDDKNQQAKAYNLLGESYLDQSKFSLSIEAYKKALARLFAPRNYSGMSSIYSIMGGVEEERGQYEKCMQYYILSLQMAKKANNKPELILLANLYSHVGDYATAMEEYRQEYQKAETNKNYIILPYLCRMMGETFFLEKAYDSARLYYNLSVHCCVKKYGAVLIGDTEEIRGLFAKPYARLGEVYFALHKYDTALMYLNHALTHFEEANDRNQLMWVLLRLTKVYNEKGDLKKALQNAQQLLHVASETGARQYIRDAHLMLYQLFDGLHIDDSAFQHLRLYTILKDSIDVDLSAQKLAFYKIQAEREKAQFNINLLYKEKQLQQQQLQHSVQQTRFLISSIVAILLIGFFLFRNILLKRRNEKQRLEHELELQQLEGEKSKTKLQHQATELEMQALRAQMNPHFIFNSLNSINRFILQNNKTDATEYLTKFSRLIRMILNSSANPAISLTEDLEALQLYLELECLRFDDKFSYKIVCTPEVDADFVHVPPMLLQPFAENAIWHGLMNKKGKGHLWISIDQEDATLICTITDDGIGRKQAAELKGASGNYKSMGMNITESRIAIMNKVNGENKSVEIRDLVDAAGKSAGTEVIIKIPVTYD